MRDLALLPAILALLVVGALVSPSFLTYPNLVSVLGASAARA
jgi:simple sugar transport system permease protein